MRFQHSHLNGVRLRRGSRQRGAAVVLVVALMAAAAVSLQVVRAGVRDAARQRAHDAAWLQWQGRQAVEVVRAQAGVHCGAVKGVLQARAAGLGLALAPLRAGVSTPPYVSEDAAQVVQTLGLPQGLRASPLGWPLAIRFVATGGAAEVEVFSGVDPAFFDGAGRILHGVVGLGC